MAQQTGYMAIDQYGRTYHLGWTKHPRKALLEKLGSKHASKMYVDTAVGSRHIGWIIGGLWLTVYRVERMERTA